MILRLLVTVHPISRTVRSPRELAQYRHYLHRKRYVKLTPALALSSLKVSNSPCRHGELRTRNQHHTVARHPSAGKVNVLPRVAIGYPAIVRGDRAVIMFSHRQLHLPCWSCSAWQHLVFAGRELVSAHCLGDLAGVRRVCNFQSELLSTGSNGPSARLLAY